MSPRRLAPLVLALALLVPPAAEAQAPASTERFVAVTGRVSEAVEAPARETNATIAAAIREAQTSALPRAVADARERAGIVARAAGLTLGGLLNVDESRYGPFGREEFGRFGPGEYCGTVTRNVYAPRRRGERRRRVIRRVREQRCFVPDRVTVSVAVTFAVTG